MRADGHEALPTLTTQTIHLARPASVVSCNYPTR